MSTGCFCSFGGISVTWVAVKGRDGGGNSVYVRASWGAVRGGGILPEATAHSFATTPEPIAQIRPRRSVTTERLNARSFVFETT